METPIYNQFRIYFQRVNANSNSDDPAQLYAQAFEKFVNRLLADKKENAKK